MDTMHEVTGIVWLLDYWWQILVFAAAVDVVFWSGFFLIRWWVERRRR